MLGKKPYPSQNQQFKQFLAFQKCCFITRWRCLSNCLLCSTLVNQFVITRQGGPEGTPALAAPGSSRMLCVLPIQHGRIDTSGSHSCPTQQPKRAWLLFIEKARHAFETLSPQQKPKCVPSVENGVHFVPTCTAPQNLSSLEHLPSCAPKPTQQIPSLRDPLQCSSCME